MAAFRFRFQRVLRVREIEEHVALGRYAEAAGAARAAEQRAQAQSQARTAQQAELTRLLATGALAPRSVIAAHVALDQAQARLLQAHERSRTLSYQAQQLRAPWEDLRRARRGLEALRTKHQAAYATEVERSDGELLDEIASERSRRMESWASQRGKWTQGGTS